MTLLSWQIAENLCALGIVLASAPRLSVVIGRTSFIVSCCRFLPHQRRVRVSPARFPDPCNVCELSLAATADEWSK